jgi:hypothetical protein
MISPMDGFVNPHKVVVQRYACLVLGNAQNEGVLEMKTKVFGHGGLKCSFSQMEGDLDLQEIHKLAPLPKKKVTKKKAIIITMKVESEEGEKVRKIWANGEVLHLMAF